MRNKLTDAISQIWFASGTAQLLMFSIWTMTVSGFFNLTGYYQIIPTLWKFAGFACLVVTIWGSLAHKRKAILVCVGFAILTASIYSRTAVQLPDEFAVRGLAQSQYMSVFVLIAWGYYLANLYSRQILARGADS